MIKAVIIGFSHMHVNEVALYISEQPSFELVAVADVPSEAEAIEALRYTPVWNMQNVKENYCANVYEDYKQMLDEVKPDIAFILTENAQKIQVVEECAKRGINICIEKPIALNLEEALKMQKIIKEAGIEAVVNWPVMWRPYVHKMRQALEQQIVGEPIKLHYMNGHTGPLGKGAKHRGVSAKAEEMTDEQRSKTWWHQEKLGGGVYLDISCYGAFFTKWLMGDGEESVLAYGANLNTPFGDTADNFAAIVKYDGKMSVLEGTWTTPRVMMPSGPTVLCKDGVITCTGGAENQPDVKVYDIFGEEVPVPEFALSDDYKNMPWHYAAHVNEGKPIHEMLTFDKNVEIMAIMDALMKSSKSGKEEKISD